MKGYSRDSAKRSSGWLGIGRSETGHVRPTNQDAFAVLNDRLVWIVADGMGGHPAGDLAAHMAVEVVTREATRHFPLAGPPSENPALTLSDLLITADHAIKKRTMSEPALDGMGTTIVAMAITFVPEPVAHLSHLGDSRAYLYRDGTLTQLTRDHTLVEQYLQSGLIDTNAAKSHPKRHVLTRALGMDVGVKPDHVSIPLKDEDLLVLCSDGLTKMLEDRDIAAALSRAAGDPAKVCNDLVEEALRRGGEDNVTVIVCMPAREADH